MVPLLYISFCGRYPTAQTCRVKACFRLGRLRYMELLKIGWSVIIIFFALILVFIWSKVIVISHKLTAVVELLQKSETIDKEFDSAPQTLDTTAQKNVNTQ